MIIRFKSVEKPDEIAFIYSSSWSAINVNGGRMISDNFGAYQTYGDGLVQHSGEFPISEEMLPDFLFSLLEYLETSELTNEDKRAMVNNLFSYNSFPCDEDIRFLLKIKYKENKRQYYSLRERKVSSRSTLQYDTRYKEVPEYLDGGIMGVWKAFCVEYNYEPLFPCVIRAFHLRERFEAIGASGFIHVSDFFTEWSDSSFVHTLSTSDGQRAKQAIELLLKYRKMHESIASFECSKKNYDNRFKEKETE